METGFGVDGQVAGVENVNETERVCRRAVFEIESVVVAADGSLASVSAVVVVAAAAAVEGSTVSSYYGRR